MWFVFSDPIFNFPFSLHSNQITTTTWNVPMLLPTHKRPVLIGRCGDALNVAECTLKSFNSSADRLVDGIWGKRKEMV